MMNAKSYCEMVEQKYHLQKKLIPQYPIREDNTPLTSLKDSGLNLIFEPSIKKDYQYLVRMAVLEKIGRISRQLDDQHKVLIIRSSWRSFEHQEMLWANHFRLIQQEFPSKSQEEISIEVSNYIAPRTKSMHSTGGAVDALIFDLKKNCVLDFGTNHGYKIDLNNKCYPYHPGISPKAKRNRKILIDLFESEDFVCDLIEYWHFDYGNAVWAIGKSEKFALFDVIGQRNTK